MKVVASTVGLKWVDDTLMVGADSRGRSIVIGSANLKKEAAEGQPEYLGMKASDLLLLAAASCSTYDVVTILQKQREPLLGLEVTCTGGQISDAPYAFVEVHLHYKVRGEVNAEKLARAIQLSEEKYCSVLATLKPGVKVSSDFEIGA
jgi:putative redox protein